MSSVTTAVGVQGSTQITQEITEYLTDRGLDIEVALSLGVYASSQYGTDCIALPYFKDGEVVNHKYKNLNPKDGMPSWTQQAGGEKVVWNRAVLRRRNT